jgi:DMSO/TMAO reductase YedYZ molybdopterin-dependent catalytic subunit
MPGVQKSLIWFSLLWLVLSCSRDDEKIVKYNKDGSIDVTTMATPYGGSLRRAEEGPVRSALGEPGVDLNAYRLEVTGLVDSSFTLTWEEIQNFPSAYTDTMIMYCVEGWEVWGNWKGILIEDLLEKARIQHGAQAIQFGCIDGYTTSLPLSYLLKYGGMLAYEVNGAPLLPRDGFPLRVIAFGKFGYKWAKWVNKVEVISESQLGFWEMRGYTDQANVPLERRKYYEGKDVEALEY